MAIHVALYHKTHYTYDKLVGHGPHVVRLRPAPHSRTKILSYSQKITGGEHFINWQQDPFANWNARLVFPDKMKELCVEVELVAEMAVHNPFDFFIDDSAQTYPFIYEPVLKKDLAPFMELPAPTPKLLKLVDELLAKYLKSKTRTIDFIVEVNQRLQQDIKYTIRLEPGVQTPEETLTKLSGSCRDTCPGRIGCADPASRIDAGSRLVGDGANRRHGLRPHLSRRCAMAGMRARVRAGPPRQPRPARSCALWGAHNCGPRCERRGDSVRPTASSARPHPGSGSPWQKLCRRAEGVPSQLTQSEPMV